jgi:hypothetical protein
LQYQSILHHDEAKGPWITIQVQYQLVITPVVFSHGDEVFIVGFE